MKRPRRKVRERNWKECRDTTEKDKNTERNSDLIEVQGKKDKKEACGKERHNVEMKMPRRVRKGSFSY